MSSSSNLINYSLRQNKAIERAIAFDGLREVMARLEIVNPVYVGFGSVWFSDFHIAHRMLGLNTLVSIEWDETTFKRAKFNRPYKCVEIKHGPSSEVIPELLRRRVLRRRPWILWLDYDQPLDEDKLLELSGLVEDLPDDSFLLTTFNARPARYGSKSQRQEYLNSLLGDAAPTLTDAILDDEYAFAESLAEAVEAFLLSKVILAGRKGSGVPAFRLPYKDSVPMVTVGMHLPRPANLSQARALLEAADWIGKVSSTIATAPLTTREVAALLSRLPSQESLTLQDVQKLGFDLDPEQLSSFEKHYLRFPAFAQMAH